MIKNLSNILPKQQRQRQLKTTNNHRGPNKHALHREVFFAGPFCRRHGFELVELESKKRETRPEGPFWLPSFVRMAKRYGHCVSATYGAFLGYMQ
jgi:hypothetical protein